MADDAAVQPLPGSRILRLLIEYDGTEFAGWQAQPGQRTVQGVLEETCRRVLDRPSVNVIAAGRTDSGVHAAGQVAHIATDSRVAVRSVLAGVNSALPADLRLRRVDEAEPGFHARFSATAREYRYQIWNGEWAPPFLARYVHQVYRPLDVRRMREAAALFVGTHDLSSFRSVRCGASTPIRTVSFSDVGEHGRLLVYAIRSRGFLQHMVRIIVGSLIDIGRGRLAVADLARIIAAADRRQAPMTAPPTGLFLYRVLYQDERLAAVADPVLTYGNSAT